MLAPPKQIQKEQTIEKYKTKIKPRNDYTHPIAKPSSTCINQKKKQNISQYPFHIQIKGTH